MTTKERQEIRKHSKLQFIGVCNGCSKPKMQVLYPVRNMVIGGESIMLCKDCIRSLERTVSNMNNVAFYGPYNLIHKDIP